MSPRCTAFWLDVRWIETRCSCTSGKLKPKGWGFPLLPRAANTPMESRIDCFSFATKWNDPKFPPDTMTATLDLEQLLLRMAPLLCGVVAVFQDELRIEPGGSG